MRCSIRLTNAVAWRGFGFNMADIQMADWKVTRYQKRLIKKVLASGRLTYGDMTRKLEKEFSELHDRKYGLFTNSGTSALKIALGVLKEENGWKDGDEVIIPAVTFVATMNVVIMNNLKPVLVDVESDTVNIDPLKIEEAITAKTRAIIPVHLLGQPADMAAIMKIAKKHNLRVIEDSCETMFVKKAGKVVGSQGDVACFSSYIAHLLVTGVGGVILTNDQKLATLMRSTMFHGRDESYLNIDDNQKTGEDWANMVQKRFLFPRFGYSDRATELEAALGLGDLKNWEQMIHNRQENARYLMRGLEGLPIIFPVQDTDEHAFMFFPALVEHRDDLVWHLEERDIHTRTMMPLTIQPIVQKYIKGNLKKKFPVAAKINETGILLPCHQHLIKKDLDRIITEVKNFYA